MMIPRHRRFLPIHLLLVLVMLLPITPTIACGGFFCQPNRPVVQSGEAIVFAVSDTHVEMHIQILYEGPAEAFSWVVPVPTSPTLSIGTDVLFQGLFDSTLPTFNLNVDNAASDSCTLDQAMPFFCPMLDQMAIPGSSTDNDSEAIVVQQGSVGPFDYVVLQAAESDPSSVFDWLETNGYDQPDRADALLQYYALQDMQFVALRLQKDTDSGEVEPIVLTYPLPALEDDNGSVQVSRRTTPLACVPIQLTSIAATDNMPIQVYVLGSARAVPLNYLEVELDDRQVDWVGCWNNATCYDDNYRQRFQQVLEDISEHSFVTEYAGSTDILQNRIAITDVNRTDLERASSPMEFLTLLANANVPATRRVLALVDEYIPPLFPETAPPFCDTVASAYAGPSNGFGIITASCLWNYAPSEDWIWNPEGLAQSLHEQVFVPAQDAQDMVLQYPYMTRLYAQLNPEQMNKDPFFAFQPDLPDVSHIHSAVGAPECGNDSLPFALEITVEGYEEDDPMTIPATLDCIGWVPTSTNTMLWNGTSPARQVAVWGFAEDGSSVVVPRSLDGTFDVQAVQVAINYGDSLVVNQTIPEFTATTDIDDDHNNTNTNTTMINATETSSSSAPDKTYAPKITVVPEETTSSSPSSFDFLDEKILPEDDHGDLEDNNNGVHEGQGKEDMSEPTSNTIDTSAGVTKERGLVSCALVAIIAVAAAFGGYYWY